LQIFEKTVGFDDPRYRESLARYERLLRQNNHPTEKAGIEARADAFR